LAEALNKNVDMRNSSKKVRHGLSKVHVVFLALLSNFVVAERFVVNILIKILTQN